MSLRLPSVGHPQWLVLVASIIGLQACSPRDLSSLKSFQDDVKVEFQTAPPGVEFRNGAELVMSFEDDKFRGLDSAELHAHAARVARFSLASFPWPEKLRAFTIGYVAVDTVAGRVTRRPYRVVRLRPSDIQATQ